MLVVAGRGEGDLGKSEIILGAGQRRVQHQHIALEERQERESKVICIRLKCSTDVIP